MDDMVKLGDFIDDYIKDRIKDMTCKVKLTAKDGQEIVFENSKCIVYHNVDDYIWPYKVKSKKTGHCKLCGDENRWKYLVERYYKEA